MVIAVRRKSRSEINRNRSDSVARADRAEPAVHCTGCAPRAAPKESIQIVLKTSNSPEAASGRFSGGTLSNGLNARAAEVQHIEVDDILLPAFSSNL
jgi:hypothetical protein